MILHLSSQQTGGAGIAAMRLHQVLFDSGMESRFLTREGTTDPEQSIDIVPKLYERFWQRGLFKLGIPCTEYRRWQKTRQHHDLPNTVLSGIYSDYHLSGHPLVKKAGILHLHWITGMFDWPDFFEGVNQPIIWTLHDMNPFMGVFHYELDLGMGSQRARIFEQKIKEQKVKLLQKRTNMVCVAPSKWLSEKAKASAVLGHCEHHVIRNAIDTNIFRPYPGTFARDVFDLPVDKKILLVIAERLDSYRKGMDLLIEGLKQSEIDKDWQIVSVGQGALNIPNRKVHAMGIVHDTRLVALLYSAADLLVIPSREDNLPNVILESLCCGTPVVGMSAGGVPEAIESPRDGVIAKGITPVALAEALTTASNMQFDGIAIRENAVARFDGGVIAKQYRNIYNKLIP